MSKVVGIEVMDNFGDIYEKYGVSEESVIEWWENQYTTTNS